MKKYSHYSRSKNESDKDAAKDLAVIESSGHSSSEDYLIY